MDQFGSVVVLDDSLAIRGDWGEDLYALSEIERVGIAWSVSSVPGTGEGGSILPRLHLSQNAPNPLVPKMRIDFSMPDPGTARLDVFDLSGRKVRELISEPRGAGDHSVTWDGQDDFGQEVAGGVYFYRLNAPGIDESRKMLLLR